MKVLKISTMIISLLCISTSALCGNISAVCGWAIAFIYQLSTFTNTKNGGYGHTTNGNAAALSEISKLLHSHFLNDNIRGVVGLDAKIERLNALQK